MTILINEKGIKIFQLSKKRDIRFRYFVSKWTIDTISDGKGYQNIKGDHPPHY